MERNISKENMKECSSKSVAADKFLLIAYRKKRRNYRTDYYQILYPGL